MRPRLVRLAAAVVVVLASALTAGELLAIPPADGASAGGLAACTTTRGVLVAVDFSHWHETKPVKVGCAAGRQMNGLDAMHHAGFLTAGDEEDGDAFVCRIGIESEGAASERPTPAEESCVSTPPASAYWSFWVADAGQSSWSYAEFGVLSYQPPAGSIEGWAFGSGGSPVVTPAQVRAAASPPTTTTTSTVGRTSTTMAPTTSAPASVPSTTPSSRPPSTTKHSTGPTSSSQPPPSTSAPQGTSSGRSRIAAVKASPGPHSGGSVGSPAGVFVTAGIVLVLAAIGGAFSWRRRRAA